MSVILHHLRQPCVTSRIINIWSRHTVIIYTGIVLFFRFNENRERAKILIILK